MKTTFLNQDLRKTESYAYSDAVSAVRKPHLPGNCVSTPKTSLSGIATAFVVSVCIWTTLLYLPSAYGQTQQDFSQWGLPEGANRAVLGAAGSQTDPSRLKNTLKGSGPVSNSTG